MPTYEFRCDDCRDIFEERRKMDAAGDPAHCPTCGRQARRVISLVNAFTSSGGHKRAVSGSGGCGSCTPSPTACPTCSTRR